MCEVEFHGFKQALASDPLLHRAGVASVNFNNRFILLFGGRTKDTFHSDVLTFDTTRCSLQTVCKTAPFAARSYHTCTLVGSVVWLIGGGDDARVLGDAWCFNPKTRKWAQPNLQGDIHLLQRTAHGAIPHPRSPSVILIFGGYGLGGPTQGTSEWLSDLVTLDTITGQVSTLKIRGSVPEPRAYHSFCAIGTRCYALYGRTKASRLCTDESAIACYDTTLNQWTTPTVLPGEVPEPRSSHRVSVVGGAIVLFGGAGVGAQKARLADMHLLLESTDGSGAVRWCKCTAGGVDHTILKRPQSAAGAAGVEPWPARRAGHAQEFIGGKLYVMAGYTDGKRYAEDIWSTDVTSSTIRPASNSVHATRNNAALVDLLNDERKVNGKAAAAAAAGGVKRGGRETPPPEVPTQWKNAKRSAEGEGDGTLAVQTGSKRQRMVAAVVVERGKKDDTALTKGGQITSNGGGSGAVETGALGREIEELKNALRRQREAEAKTLREKGDVEQELMRHKEELRRADAKWREEAADSSRWKQIAEETHQKLTAAEQRYLKTQAQDEHRHATEVQQLTEGYQRAREQLQVAKTTWAAVEADLQSSLDDFEKKVQAMKNERDSLKQQLNVTQKKSDADALEKVRLTTELDLSKKELTMLQQEATQERQRLSDQLKGAEALAAAESAAKEAIERRLAAADSALHDLRRQLSEVKEGLKAEQTNRAGAERHSEQLTKELQELKTALNEKRCTVNCKKAALQQSVEEMKRDMDKLLRQHGEIFNAVFE